MAAEHIWYLPVCIPPASESCAVTKFAARGSWPRRTYPCTWPHILAPAHTVAERERESVPSQGSQAFKRRQLEQGVTLQETHI